MNRPGLFRHWPRSAGFQLALVALLITMIWTSIFLHLSQERAQDERGAWEDGANLASGFGESAARTVEAVDQVLLMVRALYKADPAHFDIATLAPSKEVLSDLTLQISITDAKGIMLGSNLGPSAGVDLSDREHVRVHFTDPSDFLFVSKPVFGRISNKWSIQFTRKLFAPDGAFAGVVVVSLNPDYLARFYDSIAIGHGSIVLTGLDGVIRAQAPSAEGAMGKTLPDSVMQHLKAPALSGHYTATDSIDGVERLFSYRRLAKYPMAVVVGLASDEVFGQYQRDRREYLFVGSFLTLLVALIGLVLIRQGRRLLLSQRSLSATLANIGQGIMMVDAAGTVQVVNSRVIELLELPPDLAHPEVRFADILKWQLARDEFNGGAGGTDVAELARNGGIGPSLYERTRANGITLEVRTQLLEDGGAVRTYTDITERKRNELSLAAARDAAEAATRVQSDFLAVMSHEIRTPMNGISGMAGLLLDSELSVTQRRFATTLREAADSLMQIIDDILDFSKLQAHRMEIESAAFDLEQLIASVVDLMQVRAEQKHVWLRTHVVPGTPTRLLGDPGRLRQVLLNLVGNALKFTAEGGVTIEVAGVEQPDGTARMMLAVRDTGIGIPVEAQARLFEQFYQVDGSSSRGYGGTGLGLSICQRLVERMGGSIVVQSAPGAGAAFIVEVALEIDRTPTRVPEAVDQPTPDRRRVGRPARRLRVLLAEDNGTNRLVATTRLEMLGHRVDSVAGGAEAIQMVQTAPYDLVLMDVMMPGVDGLTATRAIRALPGPVSEIPIVAMTANVLQRHRDACRDAGMDAFLSKPFTPEELARVIDRAVTGSLRPADAAALGDVSLDREAYDRLEQTMGPELAQELRDAFFTEAKARIADMQLRAAAQDWPALRQLARQLFDAGASVGFARLAELAERIAADPEQVGAADLLARLPAVLIETNEALTRAPEQPAAVTPNDP